jgi:hypothetical protein
MVIPFPAAAAAPQLISVLLDRCIGFLEGFEDDPQQCVAPLLTQLRQANVPGLLQLQVPCTTEMQAPMGSDFAYADHAGIPSLAFTVARHDHREGAELYRWSATRFDDAGRLWRTSGVAVVDDFGNLVEVPA